jgi:DNA topoisomerase-1
MAKNLVIVESPTKARTVGRFLGRDYTVEASIGHVRDLPANRLGVDVEHGFTPRYVVPAKKKDVVKRLKYRRVKQTTSTSRLTRTGRGKQSRGTCPRR